MRNETERLAEFGEFAVARQQHLLRTAYLLCGDWHDAQDLAQTALTNLCYAWHQARRADSLDDYAHRILINAYLSRRRKLGRERQTWAGIDPSVPSSDQPELRLTLLAALAELPRKGRAVLVLRFWHDLSVEATAAIIGCSTGTVKSQTSRALAKLRVVLGDSLTDFEPRGLDTGVRRGTDHD
ncbi:RNA polymerase sigma-70 factor (sigma-E family) [Catenulispora sp. GP43]|uniref:SigE family RNA polymerase sigma factor n=1 Tax=Catenulispora sp. GP43 TaxID=3156263 RepID=UPI003514891E